VPKGLGYYHDALSLTDTVLAKALGLSETAQIARIESRLREFILAAWEKRAATAIDRGTAVARRGGKASAVESAVERAMRPWQKDATPKMTKAVEDIYRLARTAGWKKATGQTKASLTYDTPNLTEMQKAAPRAGFSVEPSFDLIDEDAIDALKGHQVLWVGEHYDENISKAVADAAREAIVEAGDSPVAAGRLVRETLAAELSAFTTPGGFHGSATQYFEGLASNAATVSRAHGQLSSFIRVGATTYEIVNPRDRRTCPVCAHMDGKIFTVDQGAAQMGAELAAKSPDDIKKVHPWIGVTRMKQLAPTKGEAPAGQASKLAKAGFSIPPFHFRCRCAIDITEDAIF